MELKDVILSTLAEMEEEIPQKQVEVPKIKKIATNHNEIETTHVEKDISVPKEEVEVESHESEMIFLISIRERLLVLFEGFQAPNNTNIEAKMDLTLNFLEYVLATIDSRVEKIEKGNK